MFGQVTEVIFLNQFFVFFWAPLNFFEPHQPYLALETPFFIRGVILLKLFEPSYGFEVTDFEIAFFWQN